MKRSMFACVAAVALMAAAMADPAWAASSVANGNVSDSTGYSNNRARAACNGSCSTDTKARGKITTNGTTTSSKGISVSQTSGGTSGVASSSGSMSNSVSGNSTTTP
jgi:hypothetical protein